MLPIIKDAGAMRHREPSLLLFWVCFSLMLLCSRGHAAYTGLTLIPTADILSAGVICWDYQIDGPFPIGSGVDAALLNTQFGLGNWAEAGLDYDFTDGAAGTPILNGKVLLTRADAPIAVAGGIWGLAEARANIERVSYLVATFERGALHIHIGALRKPKVTTSFAGLEYIVNDRLAVWTEWIAGHDNASALSLSYSLTKLWGVSLGWLHPHDDSQDPGCSLHFGRALPAGH